MSQFLQVLRERGFVHQTTDDGTDDRPLERLLAERPVTGYIGFDPTAPSLHAGNLVCVMGLVHFQRSGHRPVVVLGGGTGMVGDPSGKSEMRQILLGEQIDANLRAQREQFGRYLDVADAAEARPDQGLVVNNAEWLLDLRYVDFLREIGRHFSVNRMLAAESVKLRLESEAGLSFLEFNYSLLQAYDFLVLNRRYGCLLQMGGADQWGNVVAGIDLIRRVEGSETRAHGVTFPLLTTASGGKMGKTEKGAVWLDPARTSPYDFYQYWINTDDRDVGKFLRIFTLLDIEEIRALEKREGAEIRAAKEALAFEATALTHGSEEAARARKGARALFGGGGSGAADADGAEVPTHTIARAVLEQGIPAINIFADAGLCESRNAARRLARQNGLYVNGSARAEHYVISAADLEDGAVLLRAGKKNYRRVVVG